MDLDPTSTEQTLGLFIYDFFFHKEDSKGANPSTLKIPVRANDLAQQPNSKKIRTGDASNNSAGDTGASGSTPNAETHGQNGHGGSTSGKARGDIMASFAPTKLEVDKSAAATMAMVFFPSLLLPARQLEEGGDHIH